LAEACIQCIDTERVVVRLEHLLLGLIVVK